MGNIIGEHGDGMEIVARDLNWTASATGAACVGRMRAVFDYAYNFALTDKRSGPVPVIEYQNAGYMLVDMKTRIEACRYFTWKGCRLFNDTNGVDRKIGHMVKIYASETAVQVVYDAIRLVGVDAYTGKTPIAGIMEDLLCVPVHDGGNMGARRRQLRRCRHPESRSLPAHLGDQACRT